MKTKGTPLTDTAELRKKAEALAEQNESQTSEQFASLTPEATRQMLHELRVHQIQLEMQNEELRLAQAELSATRAHYFDLYDLTPVGYVTTSEKGLFLEANLTVASLLGVERNKLVIQPVSQFIFKEDQHIYYLHRKELFETKAPQACELRMVKNDGTIFWARLESTLARQSDDTLVCHTVISDISERKQAEANRQQAARDSEYLRQCLIAINNCPDFDSALAGLVRLVVDSGKADCAALYLIEGQDAVLRHQIGLAPALVKQVSRRPLSTGYIKASLENPHEIINVIAHFPEQRQLCEAYGLRHLHCMALMAGEQPIGFLSMVSRRVEPPYASDIEFIRILALETGSVFLRLRVEEHLMRANAQQRIILGTTPVGIVHLIDRKVQWSNPAFSRILGYTDEEIVGLDSASFYLSREEYERVGNAAYEMLSQGESYSAEVEMKRKDGSLFWASLVGKSVDPQNQSEGSIWILHDITESKHVMEQLLETSEQLLEAQRIARLGSYSFDVATDRFTTSEVLDELFGILNSGITKNVACWLQLVHPQDRAEIQRYFNDEVLKGKSAFDRHYRIVRHNDQQERWVHGLGKVTFDDHGQPIQMIGTIQDITERKQAELALSKSRRFLADLIENSGSIIFVKDRAGRYELVNRKWEELTGLNRQHVLGSTDETLFPASGREFRLNDLEVMESEAVMEKTEVLEMPQGRTYGLSIKFPIRNDAGEVSGVCGITTDITERKRTEDALNESRELLSLFMRHSPIYAFIKEVTSNESRVILASDNFHQMVGLSSLDMQGKTMSELFPPEFAAKMTTDDWAVVAKGDVLKLDESYNGRSYNTIKYPIVREGKTLLAGYIIDVTDQKQLEAEQKKLELQNRQLQKSESLGRMAGAIAHHFNNQLQVVMMNLQLAMYEHPKNMGSFVNLTEAMQSARKAAEVSTLMLTYIGQTAAKHEPLYLCDACQRHLPTLRTAMPQSVALETDLPSPSPVISANANQIQQILTNLITNAWEAMGETQGVIRLIVKTVQAADIPSVNRFPIDCQVQDQSYACLEVADAGCGIADKDIEKVFDPFFSTKFVGRGLGLSVVVGIAQAHGGFVTVESRPGKGSVFRVFLPLSSEAVSQKSALVAQVPKTADGGTVLVIDDESPLRKAVLLALKRSGFTVFEAKDGVEGVEVFQQHIDEICCVLCDMTMPRLNGWETLTALRKLAPGIPVILASGYNREQVMAGYHPELPQAFLSKPYELANLKDTIVRFMRKPS